MFVLDVKEKMHLYKDFGDISFFCNLFTSGAYSSCMFAFSSLSVAGSIFLSVACLKLSTVANYGGFLQQKMQSSFPHGNKK